MRGWGHEQDETVFSGNAGTCGPDGVRSRARVRIAVGDDLFDRGEDRMLTRDTSELARQAERDAGRRPGLTTEEREQLKDLKREVRELRRANEILRKASAYFAQGRNVPHKAIPSTRTRPSGSSGVFVASHHGPDEARLADLDVERAPCALEQRGVFGETWPLPAPTSRGRNQGPRCTGSSWA